MSAQAPSDRILQACVAAAAALLAVLLWRVRDVMALVTDNSDLAAPLVMGDVAHRYDDAQLVTGRLGWWGGLWVVQLLRPLPASTTLSTWLPFGLTLVVIALVAWQARRVWGPRSGAVVALVALSAGVLTWIHLLSWSARSPSWWAMGLAGIAAVALARADEAPPGEHSRRRRLLLLAGGLLALLVAAVTASGDQLAVVGAIVPLAAAGAFAAWRRRRRLAVTLLGAAVVAYGLTLAVAALAESAGYLRQDYPLELVAFADLPVTIANLVLGVTRVWSDASTLGTIAGLLGLALVLAAAVAGVRAVWRAGSAPAGTELARGVWLAFWVTALVGLLAAFVPTTASGGLGDPIVRYLHGVPLAAAAVLGALAAAPRAVLVPLGAGALGVVAALGLALDPPDPAPEATNVARSAHFSEIERIAREEGVTRGYAGYWTAYPLAIHSGRELDVTPIGTCGADLCPMYLHYVDGAYAEQPGTRSFVLVDTSPLAVGGHAGANAVLWPKRMRPVRVHEIGGGIQMGIFDHDAARDLVPNGGNDDPRVGHGGPLEPVS